MDDDDLDLVESEDEYTNDDSNYTSNKHYQEMPSLNLFNPLSRNIANLPAATGIEQMSPGKLF